ncbi:hypothetical protein [Rhodococcus sp. MEB064]|uniref:hypothetical protein n=1 Tax=Rhodococcus sp. MEB064 TaxID=1587522 RepID=UPI0005AC01CD|nr:hypothetical protein [Rhodococcus sp. MEB064]
MNEALVKWAGNNWHTFDNAEINCSIQLFRWLVEARRLNSRFYPLQINIENIVPTSAMIEGQQSAAGASRPDFRISVQEGGVALEAKRVTDSTRHCRAYVYEGMARFVSSSYGANERWGMMIGYIQEPSTADLQSRVNGYVTTHALMGIGHELASTNRSGNTEWLSSDHKRPSNKAIRLDHVWLKLP